MAAVTNHNNLLNGSKVIRFKMAGVHVSPLTAVTVFGAVIS